MYFRCRLLCAKYSYSTFRDFCLKLLMIFVTLISNPKTHFCSGKIVIFKFSFLAIRCCVLSGSCRTKSGCNLIFRNSSGTEPVLRITIQAREPRISSKDTCIYGLFFSARSFSSKKIVIHEAMSANAEIKLSQGNAVDCFSIATTSRSKSSSFIYIYSIIQFS